MSVSSPSPRLTSPRLTPAHAPTAASAGFALVLVLWVIAGLSVMAAAVSQNAGLAASATRSFVARAEAERDFAHARADLLFTLATSGVTVRGRRVGARLLRVDDFPYLADKDKPMGSRHFVALQDARGLLNLSALNDQDGTLLLAACGIPTEEHAALLDALRDFVDADDLKSLNGAESAQYRAAGLAPPPNRPLLTISELWQVYGWSKHRKAWEESGCDAWVAVTNEFGFNFATAPAKVLEIKGYPTQVATALVAERNLGDGQVTSLASNIASVSLGDSPFGGNLLARPGRAYRVTHWHDNGSSLQYWVVLPMLRTEPPWVLLDPMWSWMGPQSIRRSPQVFPLRTTTDLTEDALAASVAIPF